MVEDGGELAGFLVGLFSADHPDVAYIHFVGVAPEHRRSGMARRLYERFFEVAAEAGRKQVQCITSPVNTGSIVFHRSMGFEFVPGDSEQDGVPVHSDYDGLGTARVCFRRDLGT